MTCSQTPDTTRPIANPENPLTKPPAKAARTKRVKTIPSIGRSPKSEVMRTWMEIPSGGEAADPHGRQIHSIRALSASRFLPARFHAHLVFGLACRTGVIFHAGLPLIAAQLAA